MLLQSKGPLPPNLPEIFPSSTPWTLAPLQLASQANIVQVDVTVRDSHGNPVAGLQKSNFVLLDNGKPRPLSYFSVIAAHGARPAPAAPVGDSTDNSHSADVAEATPPRYFAIFFDDIDTSIGDLAMARNAALGMIRAGLGANDHVCIFSASATQALDCTNQAASLEQTIGRIHTHPLYGGDTLSCPKISPYEAAQIVNYNDTLALSAVAAEAAQCIRPMLRGADAIKAEADIIWNKERAASLDILQSLRQANQYLARQLGQRALLLTSDGFIDDELGGALETIIQEALRNDVVINSLETKGVFTQDPARSFNDPSGELDGPLNNTTFMYEEESSMPSEQAEVDALATLAQGTGGYFFHNSNDLTLGFKQLASSPAIAYQLGFPLDVPRDGKFHTLKVDLLPHRKFLTVQARPGYFAPIPGISAGEFFTAMDNAMRGNDERSDVPATLGVAQRHQEVDLTAAFNIAKLPFIEHLGRSDQKLIVTAALFDSRGQLAEGKRGELDMWLLPATRRRLNSEGLQTRLTLYTERPGNYRLRVVIGESTDARLSIYNQELQVH